VNLKHFFWPVFCVVS